MKIILLVAGSRAGSDFFHSLLDGHSQILQFPGEIHIDKNFEKILNGNNPSFISKQFIELYPHFFNSELNLIERHNKLGKYKNKSFNVNKNSFIENFSQLFKKNNSNNFEVLLKLHQAYEVSKGGRIKNKKIIFINTHLIAYTKRLINLIAKEKIEIVFTYRNPLSSLSSTIKNWLDYKNGIHFSYSSLFFHFNLILKSFNMLQKLKKKIFVIQLEKLHKKSSSTMKSFCKLYNIKYESCLKKSTYFGLLWWGDEISKKYLNGFNKKFKIKYDKNLFFERDIIFFEELANYISKKYGYKKTIKTNKKYIFNFLPMKCELIIWKNMLKNKKFKEILTIPVYYLMRLILINKIVIKNVKFPKSVGIF